MITRRGFLVGSLRTIAAVVVPFVLEKSLIIPQIDKAIPLMDKRTLNKFNLVAESVSEIKELTYWPKQYDIRPLDILKLCEQFTITYDTHITTPEDLPYRKLITNRRSATIEATLPLNNKTRELFYDTFLNRKRITIPVKYDKSLTIVGELIISELNLGNL